VGLVDFLSWYDWITPTNPLASIFFGILFTIILGITVWVDTKQLRTVIVTAITGIAVTGIGVVILNAIGFYV
jgi:type IV secretory pathway VirB6-like protein